MNFKTKIIIGVIAVIIIIAAILGILNYISPKNKPVNQSETKETTTNQNVKQTPTNTDLTEEQKKALKPVETKSSVDQMNPEEKIKNDIANIAVPFAERFGSYSNQLPYQNMSPLTYVMTTKMAKWANDKIAGAAKEPIAKDYFGVTSKVTYYKIDLTTDEKARVTLTLQKKESNGDMRTDKTYNQDLAMELVKQGNNWKVDSAIWK